VSFEEEEEISVISVCGPENELTICKPGREISIETQISKIKSDYNNQL
jgi:hypothetical protein